MNEPWKPGSDAWKEGQRLDRERIDRERTETWIPRKKDDTGGCFQVFVVLIVMFIILAIGTYACVGVLNLF